MVEHKPRARARSTAGKCKALNLHGLSLTWCSDVDHRSWQDREQRRAVSGMRFEMASGTKKDVWHERGKQGIDREASSGKILKIREAAYTFIYTQNGDGHAGARAT